MRALFVCGFHPAHDAVSSGSRIVAREMDALTSEGWEIVTVSFENELDRRHYKNGYVAPTTPGSRLFRLTPALRVLAGLRYPLLPFVASGRAFVARSYIKRLLARTHFDRIDVVFVQAANVLPADRWPDATLVSHDVLTQRFEREYEHARDWRKILARFELFRVKRWETRVLRRFGRVQVLSDKDSRLVQSLTGRKDTLVRYPEVPRYIDPLERTPEQIDPSVILFWGHIGRKENTDAVHFFVRRIMPAILAKRPDARLVVAGIDPPESVCALASDAVVVTGYVEHPGVLFRSAAVGVVPLRLGSGLKIKTLEMIGCGLPVVATSVGAEGVIPNDLLITVDREDTFANAVIEQLERASSKAVS
jgi:glycosyltransferase involved in cell wall biosynthesis